MPFKSKAQRAYLYANEPEVAKNFESETPSKTKLPKKVKKKKTTTKSKKKKKP